MMLRTNATKNIQKKVLNKSRVCGVRVVLNPLELYGHFLYFLNTLSS